MKWTSSGGDIVAYVNVFDAFYCAKKITIWDPPISVSWHKKGHMIIFSSKKVIHFIHEIKWVALINSTYLKMNV